MSEIKNYYYYYYYKKNNNNTTDIYKNKTCKYNKTKTTIVAKYFKWGTKDST